MKANHCKITCNRWGEREGEHAYLFKMENANGAFVELTNYGAAIVSIFVPDKHNKLGNVVLGFPTFEEYLSDKCYIGATVGRFANRIGGASFSLGKEHYQLEKNDGSNTNHGGDNGFNSRLFNFSINEKALVFTLFSKDGEGGYPGNLQFQVTYTWNDQHELAIHYAATTDRKTIANFTNHAYFNLSSGESNIFAHELTINADQVLETKDDYIPTGVVLPVADQAFQRHKVSERLISENNLIKGLNSYYILNKEKHGNAACLLYDQLSGRQVEVFTSYPGVLFYTGDYLNSSDTSRLTTFYKPFDGLCLECQHYPDAPNHAAFPSTVLDVDQVYKESITYKFSVRK